MHTVQVSTHLGGLLTLGSGVLLGACACLWARFSIPLQRRVRQLRGGTRIGFLERGSPLCAHVWRCVPWGLSQSQLASRAEMTQPALSRLETGGVIPTIPLLERISAALDADLIVEITPHAA
jgi:DNA-binding XRE family transcriptional regulator